MADIYCKHCGEPTDIYELNDLRDPNTEKKRTFKEATALFAKFGCGAFNIFSPPSKCTNEVYDDDAAMQAFVNQELSEYADDWIE